jgi:hypothetical protein
MTNPAPDNRYASAKYFLIAFGLINILAFTLLFCSLGFLARLPVGKWQFPLACVAAVVINYFAVKHFTGEKAKKPFLKNCAVILGSTIAFIAISGAFYDVSLDGQWYHQETVIQLNQGFNPAYQHLNVPVNETYDDIDTCYISFNKPTLYQVKHAPPPVNLKFLAINHFPKGTEIIQTSIYQLTGRIETAKAVNFMLFEAAFFLCLAFLYQINALSTRKKWLLAVLFTFNPVAFMQLLTFCVDGNMGCLLLCLLTIACLIFNSSNRYYLFLLIALVVLTVNTKFTGLPFAGLFGIGFVVLLLVFKKMDTFKQVLIGGIASFLIGMVCCGFNPYVTNIVHKRDIFYGLTKTKEVEVHLSPRLFRGLSTVEKLTLSLLSHEGQYSAAKPAIKDIPKIPFTINKVDIHEANDPEQMMSGFGPFFSGVLIIMLLILLAALIWFRKTPAVKYTIPIFITILISVLIIPDAWWARFVPQLWLLPLIILLMATCIITRGIRILTNLLFITLGLNAIWLAAHLFFNILATCRIDYQLQQLRALNKPILVHYDTCEGSRSNRIMFAEAGIPITETAEASGRYVFFLKKSSTKIITQTPLPQIPKPFILRTIEKLTGGMFKDDK